MAVTINKLKRTFKFKDEILTDPDTNMKPEEVLGFYSAAYPELTTGFIRDQIENDGNIVYEIGFTVGKNA